MNNVAVVYLSEVANVDNLSAEYWVKRKKIEAELNELCIFSDKEKEIILSRLDKDGNV